MKEKFQYVKMIFYYQTNIFLKIRKKCRLKERLRDYYVKKNILS